MAGYPKIWTRIRHRPWFRKLKAVQKCIWYESIMIAKEQTDDGWVCFPNVTAMAAEVGCERAAIESWVVRETLAERVTKVEKSRLILRFCLVEYNESQGVSSQSDLKKRSLKGREGKETEGKEIRLSGKPDFNQKIPDPEWNPKCKYLRKTIISWLKVEVSFGQAGRILKRADSFGHAIVAVVRVSKWIKPEEGFMGALVKDLLAFQGWPDADLSWAKTLTARFEQESKEKHQSEVIEKVDEMVKDIASGGNDGNLS